MLREYNKSVTNSICYYVQYCRYFAVELKL
jgi:hypothetical protein